MQLLLVTSSYPQYPGDPGGHFVETEAAQAVADGHSVTVLAPHPNPHEQPGAPRVLFLPGGHAFGSPGLVHRLRQRPTRLWDLGRFVQACRAHLRQHHYDRVVAHWLVPAGFPIAWDTTAPLEIVVHGSDARLLLALPTPLRRQFAHTLHRSGAQLRFVSHQLQAEFIAATDGALAERSVVRASPIRTPAVGRNQARQRLGLHPDAKVAVVLGRLIPEKRVAAALRAQLAEPYQWFVIGDGPLASSLAARYPEACFLGQLPRPVALLWLEAANVLVSASTAEGCPTAIREARQLGTRVVTAPVADVADWALSDPGIEVRPELALEGLDRRGRQI